MKITHVLKDGRKLDSIEGLRLTKENAKGVYILIESINKKEKRNNG